MPNHSRQDILQAVNRVIEILIELREKCPWDREQTFESLRTLTIEEVYELADAISKKNPQLIQKELGDVLLHIVFYAHMGEENNWFDLKDICDSLSDKLIYRHPHVFSSTDVESAREVEQNWERLKLKEKEGNTSVLSGVPDAMPALVKAHRIQDKARSVGFDWEERNQVWDKVQEEINELRAEICANDQDKIEAEFGDLFFSLINAARLFNVNPENALERTNKKFIHRFNYLESETIKKGIDLKSLSLEEMDKYWNEAKKMEK